MERLKDKNEKQCIVRKGIRASFKYLLWLHLFYFIALFLCWNVNESLPKYSPILLVRHHDNTDARVITRTVVTV